MMAFESICESKTSWERDEYYENGCESGKQTLTKYKSTQVL